MGGATTTPLITQLVFIERGEVGGDPPTPLFNPIGVYLEGRSGGRPPTPLITLLVFIERGGVGGDPPTPLFNPLLFYEKEDVAVLRSPRLSPQCVTAVSLW